MKNKELHRHCGKTWENMQFKKFIKDNERS